MIAFVLYKNSFPRGLGRPLARPLSKILCGRSPFPMKRHRPGRFVFFQHTLSLESKAITVLFQMVAGTGGISEGASKDGGRGEMGAMKQN